MMRCTGDGKPVQDNQLDTGKIFFAVMVSEDKDTARQDYSAEIAAKQFRLDLKISGLNYQEITKPKKGFLVLNAEYGFEDFIYLILILAENYDRHRICTGRWLGEENRFEVEIYEREEKSESGWKKSECSDKSAVICTAGSYKTIPEIYEAIRTDEHVRNFIGGCPELGEFVSRSWDLGSASRYGAYLRREFIKYLKKTKAEGGLPVNEGPPAPEGLVIVSFLTDPDDVGRESKIKLFRFTYTDTARYGNARLKAKKYAETVDEALDEFLFEMKCRGVTPENIRIETSDW